MAHLFPIDWRTASQRLLALSLALAAALPAGAGKPAASDGDWPVPGRTTDETHYSPLTQINRDNVHRLGLAWSADLDSPWSSSEPVAAGGRVFVAVGLSVVHAFDVVTGKELWRYDPRTYEAPETSRLQAMAWGSRGLAYDAGRIFVATKDGRLIALDARTGKPVWSTMTLEPGQDAAAITGAPRVFDGKVIIGFGGADIGRTRGAVSAYDAKTGKQLWRFWTVPGDPAKGFENEAMAMAAKTWTGEWWKWGGGGTAWNAITYDREFKRIYIGTGNGTPWNAKLRSPGGGDNLFLCSIVAVDAETGKYLWHYQTAPGESWDYNSVMDIELTHATIDGKDVPVLYHAPKNGFFYVIDRRDGKLLRADAWSKVTWATGVDLKTGRPIEAPNARFEHGPTTIYPSSGGAHNWLPMSTSARTGLVYLPEIIMAGSFAQPDDLSAFKPRPGVHDATALDFAKALAVAPPNPRSSALTAWDPARGRTAWRVPLPDYSNGGVLSTAGGLVFQGRMNGELAAFSDETGAKLWSRDAGAPLVTPIITYAWRGRQYVTMLTGVAGAAGITPGAPAGGSWDYRTYPRRLMTFALDGKRPIPARPASSPLVASADPDYHRDPALEGRGAAVFQDKGCWFCHGPMARAGENAPDLRGSPIPTDREAFLQVLRHGALRQRGMPQFDDLNDADLDALRQFVRARAADLRDAQAKPAK